MPDVLPCPQAARATAVPAGPPNAWLFAIEQAPAVPRPGPEPLVPDLPPAPLPGFLWPYHLPRWNAVDCFWWSLFARASYAATNTWVNLVAAWAGPIIRSDFRPPQAPPAIGHTFIELSDQIIVVVPGTTTELETIQYIATHGLELTRTFGDNLWTCNETWFLRGQQISTALAAWPHGTEKPIVWIGHSSGGATAAIASYFQSAVGPLVFSTAVTFGTVEWATLSLRAAKASNKSPQIIEFATPADPVCYLPPPWSVADALLPFRLLNSRPGYVRHGVLLDLIGADGTRPHPSSTFNGATQALQDVIRGDVARGGHGIANYTAAAAAWARNFCVQSQTPNLIDGLLAILADMDAASL